MSCLLWLLVIYVLLLAITLVASRGDITSPGTIFFASFSLMLLLANIFNWHFELNLKETTFVLIAAAGLLFCLVGFLVPKVLLYIKSKRSSCDGGRDRLDDSEQPHPIKISNLVLNLLVALMICAVAASFFVVIANTDDGTWSERMRQYMLLIRGDEAGEVPVRFAFLGSQAARLATVIAYVVAYVLVYNRLICKVPLKNQKRQILICALLVPCTLFRGGRQGTVELVIFVILVLLFLYKAKGRKLPIGKVVIIAIPLLAVFIWIFTALAAGVGRADIERDPILYVAMYLCGGLKNFDELIVGFPGSTDFFGQSTFSGMYNFLIDKFQILPASADLSYHSAGFFGDTTITIFGRWYEDFGAVGVLVMTAAVAVFFFWLYALAKSRKAPSLVHVIYIYLLIALVWASYDDRITFLLTVNNAINLLLIALVYWLLVKGGTGEVWRFIRKRGRPDSVNKSTGAKALATSTRKEDVMDETGQCGVEADKPLQDTNSEQEVPL